MIQKIMNTVILHFFQNLAYHLFSTGHVVKVTDIVISCNRNEILLKMIYVVISEFMEMVNA